MKTKDNKYYANIHSPEIKSLFEFPLICECDNKEDVLKKLMSFKDIFNVSNPEKISYNPENEIVLWIRGYKERKNEGYFGKHIKLKITDFFKANKKYYTIGFEDLEIDKQYHPVRGLNNNDKRPHPNWGHKVLRQVKKGVEFENEKEAEGLLLTLFNDYPDTSFMYSNRLITMVFSNEYSPKVKSFIFDIVRKEDDRYHIVYRENDYKNIGHFKLFNYGFTLTE